MILIDLISAISVGTAQIESRQFPKKKLNQDTNTPRCERIPETVTWKPASASTFRSEASLSCQPGVDDTRSPRRRRIYPERDAAQKKQLNLFLFYLVTCFLTVGKLWEARSRLYRSQVLQVNTSTKYKILLWKLLTRSTRFTRASLGHTSAPLRIQKIKLS